MTFEPTGHLWCSCWSKTIIIQGHKQALYTTLTLTSSFSFFFPLSDTNNPELLISFFAIQRQMGVGTDWSQDMQTGKQTELRYSYRFICNESYYGESCSKKCTPRDDRFGHYTCNRDGQLSCLPGWKGKYCEERKQPTTYLLLGLFAHGWFTVYQQSGLTHFQFTVEFCCSVLFWAYFLLSFF